MDKHHCCNQRRWFQVMCNRNGTGQLKKAPCLFFSQTTWMPLLQTSFLPSSANCAIVWWIICAIIYNQETDSDYLTGKSIYTSKIVCTWSPNGCCNDEVFKEPSFNLNEICLHAFVTKRGAVTFLLANSRNLGGLKDPAIRSKIWKLWCLCKIKYWAHKCMHLWITYWQRTKLSQFCSWSAENISDHVWFFPHLHVLH